MGVNVFALVARRQVQSLMYLTEEKLIEVINEDTISSIVSLSNNFTCHKLKVSISHKSYQLVLGIGVSYYRAVITFHYANEEIAFHTYAHATELFSQRVNKLSSYIFKSLLKTYLFTIAFP